MHAHCLQDRHPSTPKRSFTLGKLTDGMNGEKEGTMKAYQHQIEKWLAENRHRMVQCPNQPGRLLITEKSCWQRQRLARKENLDDVMSGDVFDYMYKKGLSICLTCNAMKKAKAA
jgi:hypothetical protein